MKPAHELPEDLKKILDEWEAKGYKFKDVYEGFYDYVELFVNNRALIDHVIEYMKAKLDYDVRENPSDYIDIYGKLGIEVDVADKVIEVINRIAKYFKVEEL